MSWLGSIAKNLWVVAIISMLHANVQAQKNDLYTIFDMTQQSIGCEPQYITQALLWRSFEDIQFPKDPNEFFPYVYKNGVALSLEWCFVPIDTVIQWDISTNKKMLSLMYGETTLPASLLQQPFYVVALPEDMEKPTAWTQSISINGQTTKKFHIEKTFFDTTENKSNNEAIANEFVHGLVDISAFDVHKAMTAVSRSEQLDVTYEIYWNEPGTDELIASYFEDFTSRALALQDINDPKEWTRTLDLMVEEMVLNFSGLRLNTKLLEASLLLQILSTEHPTKLQYRSEEYFVDYVTKILKEEWPFASVKEGFPELYNDVHTLAEEKVKTIFADKFSKIKDCGMKFRRE